MYRYLDHAVLRCAQWHPDAWGSWWPDLSDRSDAPLTWRPWLLHTIQHAGFAAALELASPSLSRRVQQICGGQPVPEPAVGRAVVSVLRYVLRAGSRATPFGLFAGVATVRIGAQASGRAREYRALARVDAAWLAALVERLETAPPLWPWLVVRVNNLAFVRAGHLVVEHRPQRGGRDPAHVQVRVTEPVQAALTLAASAIALDLLADKLATRFPDVDTDSITRLVAGLVEHGILVTNLNPPTTCVDPLHHLAEQLRPAAEQAPDTQTAVLAAQMRRLADRLHDHNRAEAGSPAARERRDGLTAAMKDLNPVPEPTLAVDLLLDRNVVIPATVAAEAARAAGLLVRLARRPATGWSRWHTAFLDRYGPRAVVAVGDVVDPDVGLGYPAGYLGTAPSPAGGVSDRDVLLMALAQRAALDRRREVVLDDATLAALSTDPAVHGDERVQVTTEITARVHADCEEAVRRGRFTLAIVGASRSAGTTMGRFLPLLDDTGRPEARELAEMLSDLPGATDGALAAQLCAAPLHTATGNVSTVPQVLPHVIVLGQYHDDSPQVIGLDDLAVTADEHRLYLISRSLRRTVEPTTFNAVELSRFSHPLARFLTELPHAMSVPCGVFDWGAAARLPFLPALRHGRTILAPERWLLTSADLPGHTASTRCWEHEFAAWREQTRLPRSCFLGEGDRRLGLDLAEPSHQALLRAELDRTGTATLRAIPTGEPPSSGASARQDGGWCGGYAHEIVIPLAATAPPTPTPPWIGAAAEPVDVRAHGRAPGDGGHLYVKVYGHPARHTTVLLRYLPDLLTAVNQPGDDRTASCWFLRYHDPDPHLRVRLRVPPNRTDLAMAALTDWAARLRQDGLTARTQLDTDFPETARFGGPAALKAAEDFFVADSAAALTQLHAADTSGGPDARAVTAASLLDLTIGFHGDVDQALRWLIQHTRSTTTAPPRALYDQAIALADPYERAAVARLPEGGNLLARWEHRRTVLAAYRRSLDRHAPATAPLILPELLHLHHARMIGVNPEGERGCLHLARAAALSWSNRRPTRPAPARGR